jgi:hypothetical protein
MSHNKVKQLRCDKRGNMKITCIAKLDNHNELRELDLLNDVYYIEISKRVPLFHTRYGAYYQLVTLDALRVWLKPYGFKSLDTVNLVKLDKIVWIDPFQRSVHFGNGIETSISEMNLISMKKNLEIKTCS